MSLLILGWADLRKGPLEGGGYNLVAREHTLSASKNEQVYYLRSGTTYSLQRFLGLGGKPRIKRERNFGSVRMFNLVDSYIRAPGLFNINYGEIESSYQTEIILSFAIKHSITRAFIHSLEGFPLDLLPSLKNHGLKVEIFCHDHYLICPRVNLLYRGETLCNGELSCNKCLKGDFARNYEKVKFLERTPFKFLLNRVVSKVVDNHQDYSIYDNSHFFKNLENVELNPRLEKVLISLKSVDRIMAPSNFILNYLERVGVAREKLQLVKLGLPHLDRLKEIESSIPGKPLVFCYRGTTRYQKGAHLLFKALENLPEELCSSSEFNIYGIDKDFTAGYNFPVNLNINFHGRYNVEDLNNQKDYHIGILTHIWFENSPVVMLEYLSQGRGIISPKLGGVEDYIVSETGYFYKPDPDSLLELLRNLIKGKLSIPRVNSNMVQSSKCFIKELS